MSGGENKNCLCFCCAMEPEIYVLDEPSSNLDIQTIKMLKDIIKMERKSQLWLLRA